jgi:hypothetical protein
VVKNLDQLDDYGVLLNQKQEEEEISETVVSESSGDKTKTKTLTLKRKVIVKQYAPKTFKKIR